MTYGYARVSTRDQNLERQLIELKKFVDDERNIITDKESGKNFNRKGYNSLVGTNTTAPLLRKGDLLVILSIDRLGRNYEEIGEQWKHITHTIGADIKVIDMPLLDTTQCGDLDGRFVANLVLQILSYVAERERKSILERQQQGIAAMPTGEDGKRHSLKTGRATGRPVKDFPPEWDIVYEMWQNRKITAVEAMKRLNLKHSTFYKLVHKQNEAQNEEKDGQVPLDTHDNIG